MGFNRAESGHMNGQRMGFNRAESLHMNGLIKDGLK